MGELLGWQELAAGGKYLLLKLLLRVRVRLSNHLWPAVHGSDASGSLVILVRLLLELLRLWVGTTVGRIGLNLSIWMLLRECL